jgi:hypothetical protein
MLSWGSEDRGFRTEMQIGEQWSEDVHQDQKNAG